MGQAGVCTELPPAAGARWSSPHSGTSEKAGAAASGAALLHPPSGTSSDGDLDIGPGSAPAWPCACGKDAAPPRLCFLPGGCHAGPRVRVQTGAVLLPPLHPPASAPELLVAHALRGARHPASPWSPPAGWGERGSPTLAWDSGVGQAQALPSRDRHLPRGCHTPTQRSNAGTVTSSTEGGRDWSGGSEGAFFLNWRKVGGHEGGLPGGGGI